MKYNPLGRSGLLVSELCLGTMVFGEDSQRSTGEKEAVEIIYRFIEAGGNHIDTADVYADGRSEEIVGKAIKNRRQDVVIATKVRFATGGGPNDEGLSRHHIINGVEKSLKRLGTDYIDLLYMHCWDPLTPIDESLRVFDDLVRWGKVRYIGVSNFKAWQILKATELCSKNGWERFIAAQYQYSLVVRDIETEFVDLCLSEGIGLIPWGALGGGFLSGKYTRGNRPEAASEGRLAVMTDETEEAWHRRNKDQNWLILDAINKISEAHPGSTTSQIALAWLLSQKVVVSVLIGVRTVEQLLDNLGAANLILGEEEIADLDNASAIDLGYPYRFLQEYGIRE
jgi:aryl-alcohol dehydrogenase-like predicted oxidoreductase